MLASLADHDRDLALVVQVAAARRPHDLPAVRVQRRRRLVEEGGCRAELRLELGPATLVVEMDADDLRRLDRREVRRLVHRDAPAVGGDELVALAGDRGGHAVEEDPPSLHPAIAYGS